MAFLDIFKTKEVPPTEIIFKSYEVSSQFNSVAEFVAQFRENGKDTSIRLAPSQSLDYYHRIPSVFNAVNTIARESSNIAPLVFDKEEKKVDESDSSEKLLTLLNFPNTDVSGQEFMENTVAFLKSTGNAFFMVEGRVDFGNYSNSKTRQIFCIPPHKVQFGATRGRSVENIMITMPTGETWDFKRRVIQGRHRYFYKDDHELYQIRNFTPYKYDNENFGLSPLQALKQDLDLYEASVTHNISILMQGNKLSGILQHKRPLSDEQESRLRQQFERFYQGAKNSGKVLDLPADFTFTPIGMAYDMDYAKLQSTIDIKIYNNYMIPLPTVTPDKATFSNLEQSVLSLYNNAVIPAVDRVHSELTLFLMPRFYDDWKRFKIDFNIEDIDALQPIRNATLKLMKEIGVNTINELRAAKGDEPAINGDSILQPASNVPVARVPRKEEEQEEDEAEEEKQETVEIMLELKHPDGTPLYSKSDIKEYLKDN